MTIQVNNKQLETEAQCLGQLAAEMSLPEKGVAMAMNNKMVPRAEWDKTPLVEGASVVIIKAACGG